MDYSPYEIVQEQDYPAILITAGKKDGMVSYNEVARFAAKLRLMKKNTVCSNSSNPPLLFYVGNYGHWGPTFGQQASFILEHLKDD